MGSNSIPLHFGNTFLAYSAFLAPSRILLKRCSGWSGWQVKLGRFDIEKCFQASDLFLGGLFFCPGENNAKMLFLPKCRGENSKTYLKTTLGCPLMLVTIVSKLDYNLFEGFTTYLYRCYNPVTKYQQDIPAYSHFGLLLRTKFMTKNIRKLSSRNPKGLNWTERDKLFQPLYITNLKLPTSRGASRNLEVFLWAKLDCVSFLIECSCKEELPMSIVLQKPGFSHPIASMYGIFTYMYINTFTIKNQPKCR